MSDDSSKTKAGALDAERAIDDVAARKRAMYDALLDDETETGPGGSDTSNALLEDTRALSASAIAALAVPTTATPALSIIIPMYNESQRIGATLDDLVRTLRRWLDTGDAPIKGYATGVTTNVTGGAFACEILCVNDGSKDDTANVVLETLSQLRVDVADGTRVAIAPIVANVLTHDKNRGKGAAVRTGLKAARGQWSIVMDADNATRVDQLEKLARAIAPGVAMIAGSRSANDADVVAILPRKLAGYGFKSALMLLGLNLARDTQCGFKLYRRDLAQYLGQNSQEEGFAFDIEHFLLCKHAGWQFREVGVHWEHKAGGKISVVSDGLKMVRQAKRIKDRIRSRPPAKREAVIVEAKLS
ncbi:MAG: glycosyltransferase [Phycisphaerales bacterium]